GGVPQDRNLINFYADGGLVYKGLIPLRPNDKVGVAAPYAPAAVNGGALKPGTGFSGNFFFPVRGADPRIDVRYSAKLCRGWMMQPEVQYIIRPGAGVLNSDGSLRPNAWVIAVRSALSF